MNLSKIRNMLQKVVEDHGFRLFDLKEYEENEDKYLQVVIDKYAESISLEQIVDMSEIINNVLDESDDIKEPFILDVTSSGAEKELAITELEYFLNTYIKVMVNEPVRDYEEITGYLLAVGEDAVSVELNEKGRMRKIEIAKSNIKKINRAIKF